MFLTKGTDATAGRVQPEAACKTAVNQVVVRPRHCFRGRSIAA